MYKSLWIKEFKEKKMFFAAGLILCFLPSMLFPSFKALGLFSGQYEHLFEAIAQVVLLGILIILPIFLTVSAFSGEQQKKTMSYLLSLPVSRTRIWLIKIFVVVLSMVLIVFIYFLFNFKILITDKIFLWSILRQIELYGMFFILAFLIMSITAFTSLFFDKESVAVLASMAMCMINFTILSLTMLFLKWYVFNIWEPLLFCLGIVYTISSLVVFNKGEFIGGSALKLKYGFISLFVGLFLYVVFVCIFYSSSINIRKGDVTLVSTVSRLRNDKLAFLVRGRDYVDGRVWIINMKDKKLTKFKDRFIYNFASSGKNNLLVYEKRELHLLGYPRKKSEIYLLDCNNFKQKKILTIELPEKKVKIEWFDNEEKILVYSIYHSEEFNKEICDLDFFDKEGKLLDSRISFPQYKDEVLDYQPVLAQSIKDEVFILWAGRISNGLYVQIDIQPKRTMRNQQGSLFWSSGTFFKILINGRKGEDYYLPDSPISPDGRKFVYFKGVPHSPWEIVLYNLDKKTSNIIGKSYHISCQNLWFSDSKRLLLKMAVFPSKNNKTLKLVEINTESGQQKLAADGMSSQPYSNFSLSPDEEKLSVRKEVTKFPVDTIEVLETKDYKKIFEKTGSLVEHLWIDNEHFVANDLSIIDLVEVATGKSEKIFP